MKTSPDLLQALLDRRKVEKTETPAASPSSASADARSSSETTKPPSGEKAPLPVVAIQPRPAAAPAASRASTSMAIATRGMTLSLPMFLGALFLVGAGLIGSFFLGRFSVSFDRESPASSSQGSAPSVRIAAAPSVQPFEWGKKFTVEATRSGLSKSEADRLGEYCKYLAKLGVAASAFELDESGAKVGVIFLGGADSAADNSLVKLRNWLWEIPGPDGAGRPFQSAKIRETPKQKK